MKLFGIGLSKTGTTSLAHALEILGFRVKDCLGVTNYIKGDLSSINEDALKNYDALTDTPIPSFYQELDEEYPDSKFILTVRDMDAWLKSCKKQFSQKMADKQSEAHKQLFTDIYGTVVFNEDKYKQGYLDFVNGVIDYFNNRPNVLLVLDVTKGDGWEQICSFLDRPVPEIPFPKSNVTQIRWLNIHDLAQNVRNSSLQMHKLNQSLNANHATSYNKIKNILLSFLGLDVASRIDKITLKTQNLIEKELFRTNSGIPIVSKNSQNVPLENKKSWNHFWLVDCSKGNTRLESDGSGYIINVALIEDGFPFLGIVYVPVLDILYYSVLGKGAYKAIGDKEPLRIESNYRELIESSNSISENSNLSQINYSLSIGFILCQIIENRYPPHMRIEKSKEWQTAAGHAIIKNIGLNLIDDMTDKELRYNKVNWTNSSITLDICQ